MATFEILLASDFTARSDRPTARAVQLAGEKGGKLVIAHVLEKDAGAEEAVDDRLRADLQTDAEDAELVIRSGYAPKMLAIIAAERARELFVTGVVRNHSIGDYCLGKVGDPKIRNIGTATGRARERKYS